MTDADFALPEYDRRLLRAIDAFEADGGPIDPGIIRRALDADLSGLHDAMERGQVPRGYKFDVNRARREIAFRVGFQRFLDDLIPGCPTDVALTCGTNTYRVIALHDRVTGTRHTGLVRGEINVLGVAGGGLTQPGGRLRWYAVGEGFEMADDCAALRAAKQAALGARTRSAPRADREL